ncbi:MAG: hypothetical protein QOF90_3562 [Acetobacteraceae bacterium]|jgi:hypothetical protein|nr:hypothetical protein [Acetobacteraceae bacterium]
MSRFFRLSIRVAIRGRVAIGARSAMLASGSAALVPVVMVAHCKLGLRSAVARYAAVSFWINACAAGDAQSAAPSNRAVT